LFFQKVSEEPTKFSSRPRKFTKPTLYDDDGLMVNEMALKQSSMFVRKEFAPSQKLEEGVKADACRLEN